MYYIYYICNIYYIYIYIYIYIYTHTHTYIHTYSWQYRDNTQAKKIKNWDSSECLMPRKTFCLPFWVRMPQVCQPQFRLISDRKNNITGKSLCLMLVTYRHSYVLNIYWSCDRMALLSFVNFYLVSWKTSIKLNVSALAVSTCTVWFEENHGIKNNQKISVPVYSNHLCHHPYL